ncbi:glycosyltransferase [Aneurinibacillus aneurinilyticus]|uniref:glycosyltransferase n=1 Tax=Aneurinibacillus aneurinilyticus TaxID=1391 RepID=UPI002E1D4396|nr:glycosyltransferase [Aneurinibacillus aneurinilyticus]
MEFDYNFYPGSRLLDRKVINEGPPLITIITPYYNGGKYIRTTANCVFNQTFPYFEWIIVDDGSTNKEDVDLIYQLQKEDSRIKIYHKDNGGISTARNLAIKKSTTDIIVSLDSDDLIDPTYLECGYFALQLNPQASWCYTDCVGFGNLEYLWKKPFNTDLLKKENFLIEVAMIRKEALKEVGYYDESEKHFYEDWHLWLKLLRAGKYPVHLNYYGAWYRRLDNGVLGLLQKHPEKHVRAMELIDNVAKDVDSTIQAIEFPRMDNNNFSKPKVWEWNRGSRLDSKKCKVLMLLPWLNMGGGDKFNLDLVSRMDKEQFELSIITTVPCDSLMRQKFEKHIPEIFDLTSFLHVKDWASFIQYFIKSRNIDVILLSNSYYGYYLLPWLRKEFSTLPILDYVHMEEWYWRAGGYARTSGMLADILDKTYVCTNHLKNVMVEEFGRDPKDIEVVYINVEEEDIFNPEKVEKGKIRAEVNIGSEDPVVLFPCRIHPQKRPFMMLEIAKQLKERINNIRFFVVGDGHELEELKIKSEAEGLGNHVFFFGSRDDINHFYADSDVTLICSIKEGLSLTSYESLSMGVPVVSSDVGGQKELIDEKVGKIIPLLQDEVNDFAARKFSANEIELYTVAIEEILLNKNLYKSMKLNARNRIVNSFSKTQLIERMQTEFLKYKNGEGISNRQQQAEAIRCFPRLIEDYLTIYNEYTEKEWLLESQYFSANQDDEAKDKTIAELRKWISELQEGKDWLEAKFNEFNENESANKSLEFFRKIKRIFQ